MLKNININTTGATPANGSYSCICINECAELKLTLREENKLNPHKHSSSGIEVKENGKLNITEDSTGILICYDGNQGAPIGTTYGGRDATIEINGGNIIAYPEGKSAGIGRGNSGGHITVIINGGNINIISKSVYGAGIGSGYNYYHPENKLDVVIIRGGTIKIEGHGDRIGNSPFNYGKEMCEFIEIQGGSIKCKSVDPKPINQNSEEVYEKIVSNLPASKKIKNIKFNIDYNYGIKDMYTDSDGNLYLYLPSNIEVDKVEFE